jgi:glycosyltransferase involved in cell wall biosynthesis
VVRLRSLIDEFDLDLVHGHNAASTLCAWGAGLLSKRRPRIFQSVRGLDRERPWRNSIYRLQYARYFFAVCEFTRNWLIDIGVPSQDIIVTYNGVDAVRFDPEKYERGLIRREFGIAEEATVVGHVGAFSGGKGQHLTVRAIAALRPEFPHLHAIFCGNGRSYGNHYFNSVKQLAVDLNIADRCVFADFRRDIPQFQRDFDIYVQPSTYPRGEMFPNAILEAMAMGTPWIGSDVSGIPEMAEGGRNGLLCERDNLLSLTDRLRDLLSDPERRARMSENCRRTVAEKYEMGRVVDRILEAYEN